MASRKRFTKALFLRICAVGLFLALGTFAVMHSIQNQNRKKSEETAKVDAGESDTDLAADVPVVDPDEDKKVAAVSGTDNGKNGFGKPDATSQPKSTGPPKFIPPGGTRATNNLASSSGNQFAPKSTLPPKDPNSGRIPPFNQTGSKPPTNDTKSNGSALPPIRPTGPPATTASSTTGPPTKPGGFNATNNSSAGSSRSGNSLLPPMRSTGTSDKKQVPGTSSSGLAANSSSLRPGQMPPVRSSTPPPSSNSLGDRSGPPSRPSNNIAKAAGAAGLAAGTVAASGFSPNLPKPPAANRSGNVPAKTSAAPPNNPFGSSSNSNTASPPVTRSAGGPPNPSTRNATQVTASPTRVPAASNSSSIPTRNAGSATTTPSRPQSHLSSAPITSPASSSISQPVPGERRLEGVQVPALAVQKIAPREIQVNRETTFELIVKNTGRAAADNVQVHDHVPQGTQLIETMPAARAGADGRITWSLGTLAPGQQTSIKMKLLPKQAGNIGSVAHVTFGAVASVQTVCTEPKLSIRHEAPATVLLGQNVLMSIVIENNGNGAAENVVLQTDVPDGLVFATGQKELEYSIGTLPPGQTRQVQLPLRAAKVGQARNVLVAHGAGDLRANDAVDIRVIAPQLDLRTDGPNRKFLNRQATHTINLTNQGSAAATNVQLVARLPRGLQFASANNAGQYDRVNHAVVWRLAKLDAQKTGSVQLTTVPVATGQLDINVTAAADLNQRQQATQSLMVQQLSELYFDIDDTADAIEVNTNTNYRVRVVNQGRIPANNVQVQVEFAPAIKPLSVQGGIRHQIMGQTVKLDSIPALQPGQEVSFVVTASALQPGDHRTVVSVRSDDREIAVSKEESTHVYADR